MRQKGKYMYQTIRLPKTTGLTPEQDQRYNEVVKAFLSKCMKKDYARQMPVEKYEEICVKLLHWMMGGCGRTTDTPAWSLRNGGYVQKGMQYAMDYFRYINAKCRKGDTVDIDDCLFLTDKTTTDTWAQMEIKSAVEHIFTQKIANEVDSFLNNQGTLSPRTRALLRRNQAFYDMLKS